MWFRIRKPFHGFGNCSDQPHGRETHNSFSTKVFHCLCHWDLGPFAGQRLWLWLRTLFQSCTVSLLYFTRTKCIQSFRVDQSCVKCLRKCECNAKFLVSSLFGLKLDATFLWSTWLSNEAKSLIQTETSPCTSERWPNTSRNKRNTNLNFHTRLCS